MHKGYRFNEHGTRISVHQCETCGEEFTVCPAAFPEDKGWDNCLGPQCPSYDRTRDFDLAFDDHGNLREGLGLVPKSPTGKA
jgi:hypothetical protein